MLGVKGIDAGRGVNEGTKSFVRATRGAAQQPRWIVSCRAMQEQSGGRGRYGPSDVVKVEVREVLLARRVSQSAFLCTYWQRCVRLGGHDKGGQWCGGWSDKAIVYG